MPLLDHFHAPLYPNEPWESFHGFWAASLASQLNRKLPRRFRATMHVHIGRNVEADVAEFDHGPDPDAIGVNGPGGGTAVAPMTYAPPARAVAAVFPDDMEVRVNDLRDGITVVAVIELVSPCNKDRPEERRGFAAKCVAYLQRGLGLIVIDTVTNKHFTLHDDVMELLGHPDPADLGGSPTYAAAYRPRRVGEVNSLELWPARLAVGSPLPTLPLTLRGYGPVPLDLEAAYADACVNSGLLPG